MQSFVCLVFLAFCLLRRFAWRASLSAARHFEGSSTTHTLQYYLWIYIHCLFALSPTLTATSILISTLDHDGLRTSLKPELQLCRLQFRECLQHNSSQVFIIFIYCIRNSKNSTRLRIYYLLTRDKWLSGDVVCAIGTGTGIGIGELIIAYAEGGNSRRAGQGRPNGLVLKIGHCLSRAWQIRI